jgi:hypothetical protein
MARYVVRQILMVALQQEIHSAYAINISMFESKIGAGRSYLSDPLSLVKALSNRFDVRGVCR